MNECVPYITLHIFYPLLRLKDWCHAILFFSNSITSAKNIKWFLSWPFCGNKQSSPLTNGISLVTLVKYRITSTLSPLDILSQEKPNQRSQQRTWTLCKRWYRFPGGSDSGRLSLTNKCRGRVSISISSKLCKKKRQSWLKRITPCEGMGQVQTQGKVGENRSSNRWNLGAWNVVQIISLQIFLFKNKNCLSFFFRWYLSIWSF